MQKVCNPGNVEETLSQGKQAKAHPTEPNTPKAEVLLPGNPDALFIVEVQNRLCSSYRDTSALNPSRSRWGVEEQQPCLRPRRSSMPMRMRQLPRRPRLPTTPQSRPRRSRGGGGSHSSDRLSIASPSSVGRCTGNFTSNPTPPVLLFFFLISIMYTGVYAQSWTILFIFRSIIPEHFKQLAWDRQFATFCLNHYNSSHLVLIYTIRPPSFRRTYLWYTSMSWVESCNKRSRNQVIGFF